jgi:hypothetical protein
MYVVFQMLLTGQGKMRIENKPLEVMVTLIRTNPVEFRCQSMIRVCSREGESEIEKL